MGAKLTRHTPAHWIHLPYRLTEDKRLVEVQLPAGSAKPKKRLTADQKLVLITLYQHPSKLNYKEVWHAYLKSYENVMTSEDLWNIPSYDMVRDYLSHPETQGICYAKRHGLVK